MIIYNYISTPIEKYIEYVC